MILALVNIQTLSVPVTNSNRQYGSRKMIKGNKNKVLLILLSLLLISGWFYWFELRPTKIRQECSWVKHTEEAIPAKPAMTEEQLRINGILEDCNKHNYENAETNRFIRPLRELCESENKKKIEEYREGKAAVPANEWWVQADEEEYKFCLHDKGL